MKNTTLCLLSAIGGAVVGAAVAMLVAPQTGKDLRVKIHNAFNDTAAKIREDLCHNQMHAEESAE